MGFTATLIAGYRLSDHFGLEAALGYTLRGWAWDLSSLSFGDQIDPRRGYSYDTPGDLESVRMDHHYLIIPLRATFTLGKGRVQWISGPGPHGISC